MPPRVIVTEHINSYVGDVTRGMANNVESASRFLEGQVKRNMGKGSGSPQVRTSRLLGSVTAERKDELKWWVGSSLLPRSGQTASYAYYLELGFTHWKSGAKVKFPWLRPIFDQSKQVMMKLLGKDVPV